MDSTLRSAAREGMVVGLGAGMVLGAGAAILCLQGQQKNANPTQTEVVTGSVAKDCILAVDIGTQSIKVGIFDRELNLLERTACDVSIKIPKAHHAEMDAEDIWSAVITACRGLKHKKRVVAMSCSSQLAFLPMDGSGDPLHPVILHLDRRSGKQAEWAMERVGEETFFQISGNLPVPGGISVTSLLWIKENYPEIYEREDVCFGHVCTFILKRLTGNFLIDPSNASFTGLYDTIGCSGWDKRLCGPLGIDATKLPKVQNSNTVAGELLPDAAAALGLDPYLPVAMGANDTTCATVGAGVTKNGDLLNTSGTVDILVCCLSKPLVSPDHLLRTGAFPGTWLAMRMAGAGGGSVEWFRQNFCQEMSKDIFYSEYLNDLLDNGPQPTASFSPFLSGNRHRVGDSTASFDGLTLKSTREEMLLSLLHGIVSFQFEALAKWEKDVKLSDTIQHVGGGAKAGYTAFKQKMLPKHHMQMLGETTLSGAAQLAIATGALRTLGITPKVDNDLIRTKSY
jgi:sugar (pentulose or hexulose) kinase